MAHNASRVAGTLGQEDGLYLCLEELVIQCGRGRGRLGFRLAERRDRRQGQTHRGDRIRRYPAHSVHRNLPEELLWLTNTHPMLEQKRSQVAVQGGTFILLAKARRLASP